MAQQSMESGPGLPAPISPAAHAVLDYVVASFLCAGAWLIRRHQSAAALAFANGAMVAGMSMLTDYPGGVVRVLPFRGHRVGDILQAAFAGLGPPCSALPKTRRRNSFMRRPRARWE
jgi:hypothetical protein